MRYGPDKRTMGSFGAAYSGESSPCRRSGQTLEGQSGGLGWHPVGTPNRCPLERPTGTIPPVPDLPSTIPRLVETGSHGEHSPRSCRTSQRTRETGPLRSLHRRHLLGCQKRGLRVGKTKRGKGSKIMAITDRNGLPVAASVQDASPHEVTLVEKTLSETFAPENPQRLIGDKAYDSDELAHRLDRLWGINLIAPHRSNRKIKTQDGRELRRYKRRWKVERFFAWLHNFRRLVVRYEYHPEIFQAFVHLACIIILLRHL